MNLIFIAGIRRSGTSLINQVVCSNPDVNLQVPMLPLIDDLLLTFTSKMDEKAHPASHFFGSQKNYTRYYRQVINDYVVKIYESLGKPRYCVLRNPNLLQHMELVLDIFPQAKMLVAVRDPRDQISSEALLNLRKKRAQNIHSKFIEDSVVEKWISHNAKTLGPLPAALSRYPKRLATIRYEDVVAQNGEALAALEEFLGYELCYDPDKPWQRLTFKPESARNALSWSPLGGGLLDNSRVGTHKWFLSAKHIKQIEIHCADIMRDFGYRPTYHVPKPSGWKKVALHRKNDSAEVPEYLRDIYFHQPRPILTVGPKGSWEDYGVRGPILLLDSEGMWVEENGERILYYFASTNEGQRQSTGRAVSSDDGETWVREKTNPVMAPTGREGDWDSGVAPGPGIIKLGEKDYRMLYRGGVHPSGTDAMGLATSKDGINFKRHPDNPLLKPDAFKGLPHDGKVLMGAFNVTRMHDGRYVVLFEGGPSVTGGAAQIFGTVTKDFLHFESMNDGFPVLDARKHIRNWKISSVANPRLMTLPDKKTYALVFNGSRHGAYALGIAFSTDMQNWWEHPCNPIMVPRGEPKDQPFTGRLEDGSIVKNDLLSGRTDGFRMYLMGIPAQGPSHKGCAVGLTHGLQGEIGRRSFASVFHKEQDIAVIKKDNQPTLRITGEKDADFATQAHFWKEAGQAITGIRFHVDWEGDEKGFFLCFLGTCYSDVWHKKKYPSFELGQGRFQADVAIEYAHGWRLRVTTNGKTQTMDLEVNEHELTVPNYYSFSCKRGTALVSGLRLALA